MSDFLKVMPADPVSQQDRDEASARLAMLSFRDLANRAMAHALDARQFGGAHAETAAGLFEGFAAAFRIQERDYANKAGIAEG